MQIQTATRLHGMHSVSTAQHMHGTTQKTRRVPRKSLNTRTSTGTLRAGPTIGCAVRHKYMISTMEVRVSGRIIAHKTAHCNILCPAFRRHHVRRLCNSGNTRGCERQIRNKLVKPSLPASQHQKPPSRCKTHTSLPHELGRK